MILGLSILDSKPAVATLLLSVALALGAAVILAVAGVKADREAKRHAPAT